MKPDTLQMESNACLNRFLLILQHDNSSIICPILNSLFLIIRKRPQYTDVVVQSILDFSRRELQCSSLQKKFIQKTLKNVLMACITLPRAAGFVNELYDTLIGLGASHREIQFRQRKGRVMEQEEEEFEPEPIQEQKPEDDIQKLSDEFLQKVDYDKVPFDVILDVIFSTLKNRDPLLFDQDIQNLITRLSQEEEDEEVDQGMQVDQPQVVEEEEEELVENDINIDLILQEDYELDDNAKEQLVHDSLSRILNMNDYFDAVKSTTIPQGADTIMAAKYGWMLIVCRLMTRSPSGHKLKEELVRFIFQDFSNRMDLAMLWLFEEFNSGEYEMYLKLFLDWMKGNKDFEGLDPKDRSFTKFLVEVPEYTNSAMKTVLDYCSDDARMQLGIYTLRDLIVYRPAVRDECLGQLLGLASNTKPAQRILAVQALLKFTKHEISSTIIDHAKRSIKELIGYQEQENKSEMNQYMNSKIDLYVGYSLHHHDLLKALFTMEKDLPKHVLHHLCLAVQPLFQELLSTPDILVDLLENQPPSDLTFVMVRTMLQSDVTHDKILPLFIDLFKQRSYDVRFMLLIVHDLPKDVIMTYTHLLVDGMMDQKDQIKDCVTKMTTSQNEDKPPVISPSEWIISTMNLPEMHVKGMMEGILSLYSFEYCF
jgi:hypothetical protein